MLHLLQGEALSLSLSLCSLALAEEQGCRNNTPRCKTRDPLKMCVFQKPEKKISLPTAGVGPDCVQESIDKAKQSVDNELTL